MKTGGELYLPGEEIKEILVEDFAVQELCPKVFDGVIRGQF